MTTNHQSHSNHGGNTKRDSDGQFASKDSHSSNHSGSHSKSASDGRGNTFANDHKKAAEAGRKGGENSHGGRSSSRSNRDDE